MWARGRPGLDIGLAEAILVLDQAVAPARSHLWEVAHLWLAPFTGSENRSPRPRLINRLHLRIITPGGAELTRGAPGGLCWMTG